MSRILLVIAFFGFARGALGQASPEDERALLDLIRSCNDGWAASIEQKDYDLFTKACPQEEDGLFWYSFMDAPVTYGGENGLWQQSSRQQKTISWQDLRAVAVQVYGDLAIVHYSVTWLPEDMAGNVRTLPSRRLTVYRKRDGQWVQVGGSVGPAP